VIKRPEGQYDFDSICNMTVHKKSVDIMWKEEVESLRAGLKKLQKLCNILTVYDFKCQTTAK